MDDRGFGETRRAKEGAEAEGGEDYDFGIDDVAIANRWMREIKDHRIKREDQDKGKHRFAR